MTEMTLKLCSNHLFVVSIKTDDGKNLIPEWLWWKNIIVRKLSRSSYLVHKEYAVLE